MKRFTFEVEEVHTLLVELLAEDEVEARRKLQEWDIEKSETVGTDAFYHEAEVYEVKEEE